jgi:8-oxo-dGTP diphosphatase
VSPSLRHASRALLVDDTDAVLLCRFDFRDRGGPVVWASPGGGMDPGESELACLRRELVEEVGFELDHEPAKVWRHEVVEPGHAEGYDGIVNHYYLVRTARFTPRGAFSDEELADEGVTGFAWWPLADITSYAGTDLFSPRRLGDRLGALLREGVPAEPVELGTHD